MDAAMRTLSASPLVAISLVVAAIYLLAVFLERFVLAVGKNEPPQVFSRIPFIGHTIGMARYGSLPYWRHIYAKYPYPIFTVNMFGTHLYVVNTPSLTSQVQRASKTLSFGAISIEFIKRMNFIGNETMEAVKERKPTATDKTPQGPYLTKSLNLEEKAHDMQGPMLGPGSEFLEELSITQMTKMAEFLNQEPSNGREVELFGHIQHMLFVSNTFAVYGADNVFVREPKLEDTFWEYESQMAVLLMGEISRFIVPKAYAAMTKLKRALVQWEESGGYESASGWIQARYHLSRDHGIPPQDIAAFEMSVLFGIIGNAMPSTFWLLCYLNTNPSVLEQIREELVSSGVYERTKGANGAKDTCTISIAKLRDSVPLLTAAFRETLRLVSPSASARVVLEDTIISGSNQESFLLAKGGFCQIPGSVLHFNKEIWGADVDHWNPQRNSQSVPSAAFRSFGGGLSLCPGRHFAAMEITGFTAAFILGFDTERADGRKFFVPAQQTLVVPLSVGKTAERVPVVLRRREGFQNVTWQFAK